MPGLLLLPVFLACALPYSSFSAPWPGDSGVDIGAAISGGYEPSGILWHDGLGVFFLVHDGGIVTMMASDGSWVDDYPSLGYDLEGIAVADSSSDHLYLGVENPDSILKFSISTGTVTDSWNLTTWMTGPSNSGLEALTFVPDGHHPYGDTRSGGLFYAGLQQDATSPYDGRLYIFDADLSLNGEVDLVTQFSPVPGRTDISDMFYDIRTRTLYLIYDAANSLLEMKTDGTIIAEYTLPGNDQEGITAVRVSPAESYVYIAEDDGGATHQVWRYADYPVTDTDGDGLSDAEEHWYDGTAAYNAGSDTNPSAADTDGDAFTDYVEIQSGTDPLDNGDSPTTILVNFQPFTSAAPSGLHFCIDGGTAKGSTGYGW